jgi:hypothetical protein
MKAALKTKGVRLSIIVGSSSLVLNDKCVLLSLLLMIFFNVFIFILLRYFLKYWWRCNSSFDVFLWFFFLFLSKLFNIFYWMYLSWLITNYKNRYSNIGFKKSIKLVILQPKFIILCFDFNFYLGHFKKNKFILNFILQSKFMVYYFYQFGPYSFYFFLSLKRFFFSISTFN